VHLLAEMKGLAEFKEYFSHRNDELTFIIACTDISGNTPERAIEFHTKRSLPIILA
jgi:hypothetical protein